jgi:hypothetical protein
MALNTTQSTVQQLYTDILTDLMPYFSDQVLLPNAPFVMNRFSITGETGYVVRVPLLNAFTDGATVSEGTSIADAANTNVQPTNVNITMTKKGVGADVTEESLEDGGVITVRNALLTQLSTGLAQATDLEGFVTLRGASGNTTVQQDGNASVTSTGSEVNFVVSPMALGYAEKRAPTVKMWYDPDIDTHQFRATVRNGFASLYPTFVRKLNGSSTIGSSALTLANFAKSVSNLRKVNAPVGADGLYVAFVGPATEYAIASQLNSVTTAAIGNLSDIGNRSLLTGLIGQAAGMSWYRSNNLPLGNS